MKSEPQLISCTRLKQYPAMDVQKIQLIDQEMPEQMIEDILNVARQVAKTTNDLQVSHCEYWEDL